MAIRFKLLNNCPKLEVVCFTLAASLEPSVTGSSAAFLSSCFALEAALPAASPSLRSAAAPKLNPLLNTPPIPLKTDLRILLRPVAWDNASLNCCVSLAACPIPLSCAPCAAASAGFPVTLGVCRLGNLTLPAAPIEEIAFAILSRRSTSSSDRDLLAVAISAIRFGIVEEIFAPFIADKALPSFSSASVWNPARA